jgi:hypothetical protein
VAVSSGIISKGFMASEVKRRRLKAPSYGGASSRAKAGPGNGKRQLLLDNYLYYNDK